MGSSIISAMIPFLLLPIMTRYLVPEEYGKIAMFNLVVSGCTALIGLSINGSANRRYFDVDVSHNELAVFNGNCILILIISALAGLLLAYFFGGFFAYHLGISEDLIIYGVVVSFFMFFLNIRLGQWQIRKKTNNYSILQISNALLSSLITLILIVYCNFESMGRIFGILTTSVLIGLFSYYSLRYEKLILFRIDKGDIRNALSFGVPLIPHALSGVVLLTVDRFIVNKNLGLEITGIYMVAVSLGGALNVLFNSINKAYTPWLFERLKENDEKVNRSIVRYTYFYYFSLLLIYIFLIFFTPHFVSFLVGEEYFPIIEVLPYIFAGQFFLGMYFTVTNYIFYVKKTKYLSYVTVSCGIVNFILLTTLVPEHGIVGAGFSFAFSTLCQFILTWVMSARLFKMPWRLQRDI
ncbi:hypothetical protein OAI_11465 [Vibrio cyclitrophicus FF160]|nr:hypothetical protein OAI_11465 [Vibrio cyclitrophicus FF160]